MALDRTHYATLSTPDLERRRENAADRQTRADTTEAALADAFTIQEIDAVLTQRQARKPAPKRARREPRPQHGTQQWAETYRDDQGESPDY